MNWPDERYVRLYVRDTPDWKLWPWQARALLPLLMRKVDRSGILELGRHGVRGLAATVELPEEVVAPGLDALIEDGCVLRRGDDLVLPNFIDAQEAGRSDRVRQAESRRRRRDGGDVEPAPVTPASPVTAVTQVPETTTPVTTRHSASQPVTDGHSVLSRAVPSHAVPEEPTPAAAGAASASDPPRDAGRTAATRPQADRGVKGAKPKKPPRPKWRDPCPAPGRDGRHEPYHEGQRDTCAACGAWTDPRMDRVMNAYGEAFGLDVSKRDWSAAEATQFAASIARWTEHEIGFALRRLAGEIFNRGQPLHALLVPGKLETAMRSTGPPHPSSGAGIEDAWKQPLQEARK